jgi:hypothetical protein
MHLLPQILDIVLNHLDEFTSRDKLGHVSGIGYHTSTEPSVPATKYRKVILLTQSLYVTAADACIIYSTRKYVPRENQELCGH